MLVWKSIGVAAGVAVAMVIGVLAVRAQQSGPFTAAEADAGHAAFLENCAPCHGRTLSGGGEAPGLEGSAFINSWGDRSVGDLYAVISASMPLGKGGSLDTKTYQEIVSFLLEANGAVPGSANSIPTSKQKISAIANGKMPAGLLERALPAAAATMPQTHDTYWTDRCGRGQELYARYRRDADASGRKRLADAPPQLPGMEL